MLHNSPLRNKHIVKSGVVTTDYMIMEYMKEGTLSDLLAEEMLSLPKTIQLALDIAKALNYLHSLTPKVIHRDLKDSHIMVIPQHLIIENQANQVHTALWR